jgi:glycerate kinase
VSADRGTDHRVLVAPDSFKGTFAAAEVADAIARGLESAGVPADRCPVADGGEGTVAAIAAAMPARHFTVATHDPLGRNIDASFALLDDGITAVVETAAAGGLHLLADDELDPWNADTFGTGELIGAALDAGAEIVLVAAGGSATVDGGSGALRALGARSDDRVTGRLVVLCDVHTTWDRCAEVYAPQKGADPTLVRRLAERLDAQAAALPHDPRGMPRTGAAGGLSGALWSRYGAVLAPGAARVLDVVDFDRRLAGAGAVICGEGRIDAQSAEGKIVGEIAARARRHGVPVHAFAGRSELDDAQRRALGLDSITTATTLAQLEAAGVRLACRLLARR